MQNTAQLMQAAYETGTVIPAFNIPYLPMMESVVGALRDTDSFGLVAVAHLEFHKFEAKSLRAIRDEYGRVGDERHTRLHLDHTPVIDEDGLRVDYEAVIGEALELGYGSVMVDGSRLPLDENIAAARKIADMAHAVGVPVEAELGAVLGHEDGPLPPYEELFASGRGFTDPEQARRFVAESGADWLSVAIGNVHGAISRARKGEKKIAARLNIEHLDRIHRAVPVTLVLHGGTGIPNEYIRESIRHGIAKMNIATALRQPYEAARETSVPAAQRAVYDTMVRLLRDDLGLADTAGMLTSG